MSLIFTGTATRLLACSMLSYEQAMNTSVPEIRNVYAFRRQHPHPGCIIELLKGMAMWQPNEKICIKFHIAGSIATLVCGFTVIFICLAPVYFPGAYRLLLDDRIGIIIPYLLFIALGESIFSIWYFLFRK